MRHILSLAISLFLLSPAYGLDLQAVHNPAWATPVALSHSENFFAVVPGVLYRSAQPDAGAFKAYAQKGIRTVINLRANHTDNDEAKGTPLILKHVPINTGNIDDNEVAKSLALIRTAEKPVLVHCQHGADRTGTVIAMYRILEQDWTKEQALDELQNGGYGFHTLWRNIPVYIRNVDVEKIRAQVTAFSANATVNVPAPAVQQAGSSTAAGHQ